MSARTAARHFGISRDSVRKMLSFSVPPGYRRQAEIKRPKLDGFTEIIDVWLAEDQGRNRKQRHTAKRVLERLRDEHGFTGGYTIIKAYMRERERRGREMFVPLTHPPGHAQADFGDTPALLKGLLFGPDGAAFLPTHTRKGGRLYRYYVSQTVLKHGAGSCPVGRVPAGEIEAAVIDQLRAVFRQPEIVAGTWKAARAQDSEITEADARDALTRTRSAMGRTLSR